MSIDRFQKICAVTDIPEGGALAVEVGEVPVALVRTGGEIYALADTCSHAEVSLSEGEVYDGSIECWLHGSCFDLRTGKPTNPPATRPVPTYRVRVADGEVHVSLSAADRT